MPPPLVPEEGTDGDLFSLGHGVEYEGEQEPFRVESDILSPAGGRSIVSLQPEPEGEASQLLNDQLNSRLAEPVQQHHIITPDEQPGPEVPEEPSSPIAPEADMDIPAGALADDELPEPAELPAAVASAKKRGRPSATPAKTPAKAKTPKTASNTNGTASRATSGRKRKADEVDDDDEAPEEATPAKRPRGRPARGAAATASARLAAKSAKKSKPGRPKGSATVPKGTTNPKRGGPKASSKKGSSSNDEVVPKGEYEVEEILESVIDADTFEHMYRVKWKGYGLDEATWEPKTNLEHASALIKAFDAEKKKQTRKPRAAAAATNGTAAPKAAKAASKSKSKEVKKPGRPPGRPKKAAGRPAAKAAVAKPVAKNPPGRPAPKRSGRPR